MDKGINAILAADVLEIIFLHVALPRRSIIYRPYYRKALNTMKDVLAISHVCRLWRGIALSLSSLWVYINVGNEGLLTQCFLNRSGAQPLWLDLAGLKSMEDWYTRTGSLVSDVHHRVARLWIPGDPVPARIEEHNTVFLELPALESLALYERGETHYNAASMSFLTLTAPNLRALALIDHKSSLLRQHFPSLMHLQISNVSNISFIDVMTFLQTTPLLETLVVSQPIHKYPTPLPAVPPLVTAFLPRLRSIMFGWVEAPEALWALAGMTLPEDRKVRIVNCTSSIHDYSVAYPLPRFDSIRELRIIYHPRWVDVYAIGSHSGIRLSTGNATAFHGENGRDRMSVVLSLLLDAVAASPIETVHLCLHHQDIDRPRLFGFVRDAPSLRTLCVGTMDDEMLDQLFHAMRARGACPRLAELVVDAWDLQADASCMRTLRAMAMARAEAGCALSRVVLRACAEGLDERAVARAEDAAEQLACCGVGSVELVVSGGETGKRLWSEITRSAGAELEFWSIEHEYWLLDEHDRPHSR